MKRRILKKPQVEADLIEQFAYIARDKVKPAERFLRVAFTEAPGLFGLRAKIRS
jgi:plasmid stabilization system protein ParE